MIEEIAKILDGIEPCFQYCEKDCGCEGYGREPDGNVEECFAHRIHALYKDWRELDTNQSLPGKPEFYDDFGGYSGRLGYKRAQQDMIDNDWRKVKG